MKNKVIVLIISLILISGCVAKDDIEFSSIASHFEDFIFDDIDEIVITAGEGKIITIDNEIELQEIYDLFVNIECKKTKNTPEDSTGYGYFLKYNKDAQIILKATYKGYDTMTIDGNYYELNSSKAFEDFDNYINLLLSDKETTNKDVEVADKQIYVMDVIEGLNDWVPNTGEINMSSGVLEFSKLNLSNDIYLEVNISLAYDYDVFMSRDEYEYNGETVIEYKNDPLAKKYDYYFGDFKEKHADTDEYKNSKEKGQLDAMYREYLMTITYDSINIKEVIKQYDIYLQSVEAYQSAERLFLNTNAKVVYEDEYKRLLENGVDASLVGNDNTYYRLKGVLNKNQIDNFPVGDYGYTISLFNNKADAIDESLEQNSTAIKMVSPSELNRKTILIRATNGDVLNLVGTWDKAIEVQAGAKNGKDNFEKNYMFRSSKQYEMLIDISNDDFSIIHYPYFDKSLYLKEEFKYLISDNEVIGFVLDGYLWRFNGYVNELPTFTVSAMDGSDSQYGEDFIRTIALRKIPRAKVDVYSNISYDEHDIINIKKYMIWIETATFDENNQFKGILSADGAPIADEFITLTPQNIIKIETSGHVMMNIYNANITGINLRGESGNGLIYNGQVKDLPTSNGEYIICYRLYNTKAEGESHYRQYFRYVVD